MGQNKLCMELDGETLIRRVLGQVSKAGVNPLVVVLGHDAERVQGALEGIPYMPVFNREYERGVNSSLRAGVAAVSGTSAHEAVGVLADMPFLPPALLT